MLLHVLDLAALFISGLMVGNEFCVAAFLDPILQRADAPTQAATTPAFARRLGKVMPPWYALTLLLTALLVWLHWQSPARPWLLTAAAIWAATIIFTLLSLVPLNNRLAAEPPTLSSQKPPHHPKHLGHPPPRPRRRPHPRLPLPHPRPPRL